MHEQAFQLFHMREIAEVTLCTRMLYKVPTLKTSILSVVFWITLSVPISVKPTCHTINEQIRSTYHWLPEGHCHMTFLWQHNMQYATKNHLYWFTWGLSDILFDKKTLQILSCASPWLWCFRQNRLFAAPPSQGTCQSASPHPRPILVRPLQQQLWRQEPQEEAACL